MIEYAAVLADWAERAARAASVTQLAPAVTVYLRVIAGTAARPGSWVTFEDGACVVG